jgi:hypothetical protein
MGIGIFAFLQLVFGASNTFGADRKICIGEVCKNISEIFPSGENCFGSNSTCKKILEKFKTTKKSTKGTKHGICIGDDCILDFDSADSDGDGVKDNVDVCPNTLSNERPVDGSGCSQSQVDSDKDGICDPWKTSTLCNGSDACPNTPLGEEVDASGCSASQRDTDGDGVKDNVDVCNGTYGTIADSGCPTPQINGWKGAYDSYPLIQCSWKGGARNYFEVTIDAYWTYTIQYTNGGVLASGTCSDASGRCYGAKYNNNGIGLSVNYPRRIKITAGSKARSGAVVRYALCDVPDRENSYNRSPYGWGKDGYVSDVWNYSDTCDRNKTTYYTCPSSCSGYACEAGFNHVCVDVGGYTCNRWGCSGAYVANVTCYEKFNHNPPY